MLNQKNSRQLMQTLHDSQNSIKEVEDKLSIIDNELTKKLMVISNAQELALKQTREIHEMIANGYDSNAQTKTVFARADIVGGTYDVFGSTVHPAFIKTPANVFNFGTVKGQVFKNNANVRINDVAKESYKSMLMHDSIASKGIAFEEFESPEIAVEVEINPDDLLGATDFNIIEMLPHLPGSFKIKGYEIFTMDNYRHKDEVPALAYFDELTDFGAHRFVLPKTLQLWKCIIHIELQFMNSDGKYPFGLKHLYFLKGAYDADSEIIVRIPRDHYIDWIIERIQMHDQRGIYETSCDEQGIKLYMSYIANVLSLEIATSLSGGENPIPKNIKEFYVRIPLNRSVVSMKFDKIKNR